MDLKTPRARFNDPHAPLEKRVDDLIDRMSLEEKAAQLSSVYNLPSCPISNADGSFSSGFDLDLVTHGIGQISFAGFNLGPRENARFCNSIQRHLREHTRLGIPAIIHDEGLHGHLARGATVFPQPLALACSWNVELVQQVFTAVSREMVSRGCHQVLSPVLDVARDPRWGRTDETYGEDPFLVSRMGLAAVKGFQGRGPGSPHGGLIATAKHFAVHGQPEGGMNTAPGNYSERIIREVFLPPFQAAVVEGKVGSVMASYNEIDGVPSHANGWLLDTVLRGEMGFEGFVVSDYSGIAQLASLHAVADDPAASAALALAAGVDLELPHGCCYPSLARQVGDGSIPRYLLDRSVRRVLRAKFLLGLFEDPFVDEDLAVSITGCAEHRTLALEAARSSIVLLKNDDDVLPLCGVRSIAVIGPHAAECMLGGYSGFPPYRVSILDGVRERAGEGVVVRHARGCGMCRITDRRIQQASEVAVGDFPLPADTVQMPGEAEDEADITEAVAVAALCDVALVVLGEDSLTCREGAPTMRGDRASLDLPGRQDDLVRRLCGTGTPLVVVLVHGRPNSIPFIAEYVPAILECWHLGQETGRAVAGVLFGDVVPSGKLAISIPRSAGHLPTYYNRKPSAARQMYCFTENTALFPFGHGLSYTSFSYSQPLIEPKRMRKDGTAILSVVVTNSGRRRGDEVVQLYIRDRVSSVTRPVKELKGFMRVSLDPGESHEVRFTIGSDMLSFIGLNMQTVVEPGVFDVMVGGSSVDLQSIPLEVAPEEAW